MCVAVIICCLRNHGKEKKTLSTFSVESVVYKFSHLLLKHMDIESANTEDQPYVSRLGKSNRQTALSQWQWQGLTR